jgi:hypothetical protein
MKPPDTYGIETFYQWPANQRQHNSNDQVSDDVGKAPNQINHQQAYQNTSKNAQNPVHVVFEKSRYKNGMKIFTQRIYLKIKYTRFTFCEEKAFYRFPSIFYLPSNLYPLPSNLYPLPSNLYLLTSTF